MTAWLLLLLGVVLTVGTALFVAAEFSLVALDRPAVQRAVDAGEPGARSVLTSHRRLSTQLSACQLGITLTTLVLGFIASPSIGTLLLGPLESLGLSASAASSTAAVLAMLIATVFSMIVGEMVPKTLAVSLPLATAKVAAGPVRWFGIAMKPMILLLNGVANRTLLAARHRAAGGAVRARAARPSSRRWCAARPRPAPSTAAPRGSSRHPSASPTRPPPT